MLKRVLGVLLLTLPPITVADEAWDWSAALTLEGIGNLEGGNDRGWRGLSNLDLTLLLDTDAAGLWSEGEFFVYVLGNYGRNPSELTGDLQGISNIAADDSLKIYELWYQHSFYSGAIKVLAGLHDYNSTFYSLDAAGLFTHPSFGIGPETAQVGPSIFSTTSMALQLSLLGEQQYLLLAAYDGVPGDPDNARGTHVRFDSGDGLFYAAEWGLFAVDDFKFAVGGWMHTAEVDNPIDGTPSDENQGFYLLGEKIFYERLQVFFQAGQADDEKNQLGEYYGMGVALNDQWRDGDGLGVAVANAHNSDLFRMANNELEKSETAWELTYLTPLLKQISVQSSLYYIQNPGAAREQKNALAVGMRVYLNF